MSNHCEQVCSKDLKIHTNHRITVFVLACLLTPLAHATAIIGRLVHVVDLNVGQTHQVTLHDVAKVTVTLFELTEIRDSVRMAREDIRRGYGLDWESGGIR